MSGHLDGEIAVSLLHQLNDMGTWYVGYDFNGVETCSLCGSKVNMEDHVSTCPVPSIQTFTRPIKTKGIQSLP